MSEIVFLPRSRHPQKLLLISFFVQTPLPLCNHSVVWANALFHHQSFTWLAFWLDSCSSCMSSLRHSNVLCFTLVLRCVQQAWLWISVLPISHLTESHSFEGVHTGSPLLQLCSVWLYISHIFCLPSTEAETDSKQEPWRQQRQRSRGHSWTRLSRRGGGSLGSGEWRGPWEWNATPGGTSAEGPRREFRTSSRHRGHTA